MLVTTGFPSVCSSGSMISSVRKFEQLMKMAWASGRSTWKAKLTVEGRPVYPGVQGLPDRDSCQLIGIRVTTPKPVVQHSLLADTS